MLAEIIRIYKKAPFCILVVWLLNLVIIGIQSATPFLLGLSIDGLFAGEYWWFILFLILQLVLIVFRRIGNVLDTKTYTKIVGDESTSYYKKIIQTDADNSRIDALLDWVDEIPDFLENGLFEIACTVFGIISSLTFICWNTGYIMLITALCVSVIVLFITSPFHIRIACNNERRKDNEEERQNSVNSRNIVKYRQYVKTAMGIECDNSYLEAKAYFFADILQTILLVSAILALVYRGAYTGGQILSTITYVMRLNEYICDVHKHRVMVKGLKETITRLDMWRCEI